MYWKKLQQNGDSQLEKPRESKVLSSDVAAVMIRPKSKRYIRAFRFVELQNELQAVRRHMHTAALDDVRKDPGKIVTQIDQQFILKFLYKFDIFD